MFPLRDNIPSRTTPYVNYAMMAICTLVWLSQVMLPDGEGMIERWGMIPQRVHRPDEPVVVSAPVAVQTPAGVRVVTREQTLANSVVPPIFTLLTCVFLHGGWLHFVGNMWFLFIFGDNVEDRMGHWGYALFYLAAGVAASLAHLAFNSNSPIPTIGASGAIAGVMGAYFVLYPKAQVMTLIVLFIFIDVIVLPAPLFLGIWLAMQVFNVFDLAGTLAGAPSSGVAWWAHIGGFLAGMAVAALLGNRHLLQPPVDQVRPRTEPLNYYRVYPPRR